MSTFRDQKGSSERTPREPNILFILTDQWHPRCVGYAGHPLVRTPNLDRLAARGMVFSRMYTPCPLCMPARASIFTGQTPRGHGVRMNGIPLERSFPTVTEALRQQGYRTHNVGKLHLHTVLPPNGADPATLDPASFPECQALWNSGRIRDLPFPYYGFESADYGNGHGHGIYGHYREWLKKVSPEGYQQLSEPAMLEPPSPAYRLFNRSSFKWALPAELHPTTWTIDRSIDFLRQHQRRPSAGEASPFFLVCNLNDPHSPFAPPAPYCHAFDPADVPTPVSRAGEEAGLPPHFRKMRYGNITTSGNPGQPMAATDPYYAECAAHYYGLIELIDDQVGRLLHELAELGIEEETLVVFTADHGECLGDHGLWGKGPYHFEGVIRVPFVASWPGRIPAGTSCATPASLLDLAPTFLEASGASFPPERPVLPAEAPAAPPVMPGHSLSRYWDSSQAEVDRAILVELDEDYLGLKLRTLVTRRYRMTAYPGHDYGELFDLREDPEELHNLWSEAASQALKTELHLELLNLITATEKTFPRQLSRS